MKTRHYIISLLLIIIPFNYMSPQEIEAKLSGNTSSQGFSIKDNLNNTLLRVTGQGFVGIGTQTTNGYKLAVAGNIVAEEIVVKLKENWPDYVFNQNYNKPEIKELEKFISENGHLPKIPNAEQVSKHGANIGEIQIKLLEKIEELTLYLIEQDKKIEKLENDYDLLKSKIDSNYTK
jgi:hypothetical protein